MILFISIIIIITTINIVIIRWLINSIYQFPPIFNLRSSGPKVEEPPHLGSSGPKMEESSYLQSSGPKMKEPPHLQSSIFNLQRGRGRGRGRGRRRKSTESFLEHCWYTISCGKQGKPLLFESYNVIHYNITYYYIVLYHIMYVLQYVSACSICYNGLLKRSRQTMASRIRKLLLRRGSWQVLMYMYVCMYMYIYIYIYIYICIAIIVIIVIIRRLFAETSSGRF